MSTGISLSLAVCGDGGDDTLAIVVVVIVVLLWFLAVGAIIRAGKDTKERVILAGLVLVSILIGPGIFFLPEGISGDGDYLGRFFLAVLVPAAIGVGVALQTKAVHVGRALLISVCGALFLVGGAILLFLAVMVLGTGCLS